MKQFKITLTAQQYGWLCSQLQKEYSSAHDVIMDMCNPATISYYERNGVEDYRLSRLRSAESKKRFCEDFRDALIGRKEGAL